MTIAAMPTHTLHVVTASAQFVRILVLKLGVDRVVLTADAT